LGLCNLELFGKTGLVVEMAEGWIGNMRFKEVGALVYFLKNLPWTVEGFTVEKYRDVLEKLQVKLEAEGELVFTQRRMLIKAKKPV